MPKSGESVPQANRRIRQEALREQLSAGLHHQQVLVSIEKIADLDEELDAHQINRLKIAMEARLKLMNKYLPDLKATEISGPDGGGITIVKASPRECPPRGS